MELQSSDMKMLEESLESSVESGTSVESMFECLKKRLFASFTMEESTIKQEELKILKEKDRNIRNGVESSIESSQLDKSEYNNNTMTDSCQWQGQMDAVNFSFEVEQSTMNSEEDVSPNTSKIGSPNTQSTQKECSQNVSGKTRHSVRNRKENQLDQTTTRVKDKQNAEKPQDKITTRVKDKQNAENLQDKITTRVKDKQSTRQKNSTAWIQPDFTTEDSSNTPEVKLHDTSAGSPLKSPDTMNLKNLEVRLERIDDVYTFHSTASLNNKPKDKKGDKTSKKFTFTKINKDNEKDTVRNDRNGIRDSNTGNHRVKEAWESMPSAALYLRNFQNL